MHQDGTETIGELLPFASRRPRKVMFFGKNMSRTRATGGLVEALRSEGLEVKWLNMATLRRWLGREYAVRYARHAFASYAPDLVFVFCRDLPFSLLQEFRQQTNCVIWVEEPLESIDQDYVDYLKAAHAVFMTNPSRFTWLRERGVHNTTFVMEGFSSSFHYPVEKPKVQRDVVFIGGPGRLGQRAEFLSRVAEHHDLAVYGKGWEEWLGKYPKLRVHGPVRPRRFRKLCASFKVVLGLNQVNSDPFYFSNRTFLSIGCKGFHLTHYIPGLESVFSDGENLAWFHDLDECIEKLSFYLEHDEERERITAAGYKLVTENHQYRTRIGTILKVISEGRPANSGNPYIMHPLGSANHRGSSDHHGPLSITE